MERKKSLDRSKFPQRYDANLRSNACLLFFTLNDYFELFSYTGRPMVAQEVKKGYFHYQHNNY